MTEYVQDQSTNNVVHVRGKDREDGTPTALCNKRYRVFTYKGAGEQSALALQFATWGTCPRCVAKIGQTPRDRKDA